MPAYKAEVVVVVIRTVRWGLSLMQCLITGIAANPSPENLRLKPKNIDLFIKLRKKRKRSLYFFL